MPVHIICVHRNPGICHVLEHCRQPGKGIQFAALQGVASGAGPIAGMLQKPMCVGTHHAQEEEHPKRLGKLRISAALCLNN
jgi:hypothetical protein